MERCRKVLRAGRYAAHCPRRGAGCGSGRAHRRCLVRRSFFCSPLTRALTTARIIGKRLDVEAKVLDGLSEHDVGDWTGLTREEVEQRWPGAVAKRDAERSLYQFPGGESYASLWTRARGIVSFLREGQLRCPLLVGHAGMGRTIAAAAADLSLADSFNIHFPNDVVYVVDRNHAAQPVLVIDHEGRHAWSAWRAT